MQKYLGLTTLVKLHARLCTLNIAPQSFTKIIMTLGANIDHALCIERISICIYPTTECDISSIFKQCADSFLLRVFFLLDWWPN